MDDSSVIDRRRLLKEVGIATATALFAGCGQGVQPKNTPTNTQSETSRPPSTTIKTQTPSKPQNRLNDVQVQDRRFVVQRDDQQEKLLTKGVNLGITKPGYYPGATAISKGEYERWITQMATMNANAVRVYTIHPPEFYEALAAHNATADQPLYLFQGNWLPIRLIEEHNTAFASKIVNAFEKSLKNVIDVVNGSAQLPERPGHASGSFDADVSNYTLGYIAGIEWPPRFVFRTNNRHTGGATNGRFVQATKAAAPFERWLAKRLNTAATYAVDEYDHYRPMSFTNWPTTDHLSHPAEPFKWEDTASVNPNHIEPTADFGSRVFATYHVYPYYPDFLNFSQEYVGYIDNEGEKNNYAGYLHDLNTANKHPILIGEFGVPSSRGIAHQNIYGMDQGYNTESEQGKYNTELFEAIVNEGTIGGLVFSWQDEWFKRTWNIMEYSIPGRRRYWLNVQSPEERFGLLSFDPDINMTLSGNRSEWTDATTLYSKTNGPRIRLNDGYDSGRTLQGLNATVDEAYLYLNIQYKDLGSQIEWSRMGTVIGVDTTPERGNTSLPRNLAMNATRGIDFVVELGGPSHSQVRVASHYDLFYYEYGEQGPWIDEVGYASNPDNGVFHPIRMATSYPRHIPTQDRTIPFQYVETGKLRYGTADPSSDLYDSLTDVHVSPEENMIELRLPWQLLNFRDPSSRTITGNIWQHGLETNQQIDDIGLTALTYLPTDNQTAKPLQISGNATDTLPLVDQSTNVIDNMERFTWDKWQQPTYTERLKESYFMLQQTYSRF